MLFSLLAQMADAKVTCMLYKSLHVHMPSTAILVVQAKVYSPSASAWVKVVVLVVVCRKQDRSPDMLGLHWLKQGISLFSTVLCAPYLSAATRYHIGLASPIGQESSGKLGEDLRFYASA